LLGPGVCVPRARPDGEGDECRSDDECAAGLLCAPYGSGSVDGQCLPGWMRRTVRATGLDDTLRLLGENTGLSFVVSGVASVPTTARLDLTLTLTAPTGIRVWLTNPSGTTVPVADTVANPEVSLNLVHLDVSVPGDESANGVWWLVLEGVDADVEVRATEALLTLHTRWD